MTHYLRLLSLVVSAMLLAVKAVAGIKVSQTLPLRVSQSIATP